MTTPDHGDLLVIGGGSAGCVVAARASEDATRRVVLLEAGPDPRPVPDVIADPARQDEVIRTPDFVRHYPVERPDGSVFRLISGRVMGGGSAVNNLSVLRPIRHDFETWATFGGPAWTYDTLLPLMRAIEDDPDFGDEPLHGRGGPVRLQRPWWPDEPSDPPVVALLEAAGALGLGACLDLNVPEPLGICASPYNLVDGRRQTVADAYLEPARLRPNLTVLANTTATRLLLEGTRVRGVEVSTEAGPQQIEADRVVLSAGAYQSPHLLLLSGIGPTTALEAAGITPAHRLDGVGENFQDHAVVNVAYEGSPRFAAHHRVPKIRLIVKSRQDLPYGDLHILVRAEAPVDGGPRRLLFSIRLLDHRSRGRLSLASPDPGALPVVDPALLEHPDDVRALVDGIEFVARLAEHPGLASFLGPRVSPAPTDDLERHVRSTYITYNHAVGTCRLGPAGDPLAVVGPELRVHGLDHLWIADASVLPVIPHATTNLAAILVGEIAANSLARA
ncbi:MAG: GMC family oxidoreductase [Candidatus Limnocylindrales bacterium]